MARLQEKYKTEIRELLTKEFNYKNVHEVPRIQKIVLNMGVGEAVANAKAIEEAARDMTLIAGQKPSIRKAKKSIANFKLRENLPIGVAVTLRRQRMYEFIDRFVNIALPRVRDFKGISRKSFDGRGNYSMGILEQSIFPEIDLDKSKIRGLNVTVVTSAKTDKEAEVLLEKFGFPFRK